MFPPTDNPAQRLLVLLKQAHNVGGGKPATQVWAELFKFDPKDLPSCYRALGHLNGLVDSIDARIRQLPDIKHELYLRDLPVIRSILCQSNLHTNWDSVKKPLGEGVLTGLEFCAHELSKHHEEDVIAPEELARLKSEFSNLVKSVSGAEIVSELKLVLLDVLTTAIIAIDNYTILGNDGLKKAVAYSVGTLMLHQKEFIGAKQEPIVKRVVTVINSLCNAVTTAYRMKELGDKVGDLLRLGS